MLNKRLLSFVAVFAFVFCLGFTFFDFKDKTVANAEITYNDESKFVYDIEIPFPVSLGTNSTFTVLRLPYYPLKIEFTVDNFGAGVTAIYIPSLIPTTGTVSYSKTNFTFNSSGYGSLIGSFSLTTYSTSGSYNSSPIVIKFESQKALFRETGDLPLLTDFHYTSLFGDRPKTITSNTPIGYVNFIDSLEKYGSQCTLTLSVNSTYNVYPNYFQDYTYHYDYLSENIDSTLIFQQGYDRAVSEMQTEIVTRATAMYQEYLEEHPSDFTNLITAVIDVPFNSFKSLLNFDFLGINILQFITSILTLVLVYFIIKIILSK